MKNGSSSGPNAGGNSLAITERQKPAPSCVAALFQMLAKKKLFSSSSKKNKLLPPVRTHKFSPGRPLGGGEKTPVAKTRPLLLDSQYYPSEGNGTSCLQPPGHGNNCSEMCTPGVVARLMGLNSMPAISHERTAKAMGTAELGGHRNECSQGLPGSYGSMETSQQKQQKPGQLIDGRHDNSNQLNADAQPLWSRWHAHRLASPTKSPRSISSRNKARLIEAAAKVLEPGLQSRCRHQARRHARLEYSCNRSGVQSSNAALHTLPDQLSRVTCDVDAPGPSARNVGAASLHKSTSNQWSEEDTRRNASANRPNPNISCQAQSEGNRKGSLKGSSKKARLKDSAQMASNDVANKIQGVQRIQQKNTLRENVACNPLKQNNLKQNALPAAYRAGDPEHMVQRQKHTIGEQNVQNTVKDFVDLNRSMNSSRSLRSKGKAMDKLGVLPSSAENMNLSTKCHHTCGLRSDSSKKLKLKTTPSKAMEKDMIIAKGAGLVSEKPKSVSPNSARNDSRRQVESHSASSNDSSSSIVSVTSSSPMKIGRTSSLNDNTKGTGSGVLGSPTGAWPRRHSRGDCQNISSQREIVFRKVLQGKSNQETVESVSFNQNELINRDIHGGRVTSSLFEKASVVPVREESPSEEFLWQCNIVDSLNFVFRDLPSSRSVELCGIHKKHQAIAKASYPSQFSDDACISGSLLSTTEAELKHRRSMQPPPFSMQGVTTKRNSRCAQPIFGQDGVNLSEPAAIQDSKLIPHGEVTSTVELLLTNVCRSTRRTSKGPFKPFLLQAFESALTTLTTTSATKNSSFEVASMKTTRGNPQGDLAFDLLMERLDSMCIQLCDSGYRSFTKVAMICSEERMAAEVNKEIARCSDMAGEALADLAVSDVEHAVATGMSSVQEAFQIGANIEQDLIQELVDEMMQDMFKRL